jgi:hypothetical protein
MSCQWNDEKHGLVHCLCLCAIFRSNWSVICNETLHQNSYDQPYVDSIIYSLSIYPSCLVGLDRPRRGVIDVLDDTPLVRDSAGWDGDELVLHRVAFDDHPPVAVFFLAGD